MSHKKSTVYRFYFRDGAGGTTSIIDRRLKTMTEQASTKFPYSIILTSFNFENSPQIVQNATKEKILSAPSVKARHAKSTGNQKQIFEFAPT
jgi:hypothetical protein